VAVRYDAAFERRKDIADQLLAANHAGNPSQLQKAQADYSRAQKDFDAARNEGAALIEKAGGKKVNDTNYIFLTFVTRHLPEGMVGLTLAMILGATLSSIGSEMNSLATVSVIDIYKRHARSAATEGHYLLASRLATLGWGCYAVISAQYVKRMGSLIEAVNLLGSFFYGGMLGVFVLAFFFKKVKGLGAFWGVIAGEAVIFACWYFTSIAYLWYNVIGCVVVVATGLAITAFDGPGFSTEPDRAAIHRSPAVR
jgi:Na+/proline symporter